MYDGFVPEPTGGVVLLKEPEPAKARSWRVLYATFKDKDFILRS